MNLSFPFFFSFFFYLSIVEINDIDETRQLIKTDKQVKSNLMKLLVINVVRLDKERISSWPILSFRLFFSCQIESYELMKCHRLLKRIYHKQWFLLVFIFISISSFICLIRHCQTSRFLCISFR